MLCKHKWEILSEKVTKSKWEHTVEVMGGSLTGKVDIPHQMCDASRKHIQVIACSECGKLKRFVEEI